MMKPPWPLVQRSNVLALRLSLPHPDGSSPHGVLTPLFDDKVLFRNVVGDREHKMDQVAAGGLVKQPLALAPHTSEYSHSMMPSESQGEFAKLYDLKLI